MKKLLFTAAIAVLGFTSVNAQEDTTVGGFEKGDVFVSGSVSFGNESFGDESTNEFGFSPKVGMFLSDNIAAGLKLGYTSEKGDNDGVDFVDYTTLAVGAFGRYYVSPESEFSLFAELGVDYTSREDNLNDAKYDGLDFAFAPGISYFVSKNFAIEATVGVLGYSTTKPDFSGAESTDSFNIGLDLSDINFGVVYKF